MKITKGTPPPEVADRCGPLGSAIRGLAIGEWLRCEMESSDAAKSARSSAIASTPWRGGKYRSRVVDNVLWIQRTA